MPDPSLHAHFLQTLFKQKASDSAKTAASAEPTIFDHVANAKHPDYVVSGLPGKLQMVRVSH